MNFFEAMKHLQEGKAIRISSWPENSYIGLVEELHKVCGQKKVRFSLINEKNLPVDACLSFTAFLKADWEIYEEKKSGIENLIEVLKEKFN